MKKFISIVAIALFSFVLLVSCEHEPEGLDTVPLICFEKQIQPIFTGKCNMTSCHGGNGESYNFTYYGGIMQGIMPGDPNKSDIYYFITTKWDQKMPPKGNTDLTEEQRTLIYMWIKQGATDTVTCK